MKKGRVCSVIALLALMASLAGCGAEEAVPETQTPEEKTTVTIWTKDRHDAAYQEARIKHYNETNPDGIIVEYRTYSDNYAQALDSAFQTNRGPDIIAYTDRVFNQFFAQGHFADIMPYLDAELQKTYESVMLPGVNVFDGQCYFLPTAGTTSRLFYNGTLLEQVGILEPPATMDELIAAARAVTEHFSQEGIYGFAVNLYGAQSGIDRTIGKQANRDVGLKCGFDFERGCYDFTRYETLLEKWRELLGEDCAYPRCDELDIDPLRQMFAQGKIAMYISYIHAEQGVYQQQFPAGAKWGCAEIPTSVENPVGAQNYSLNGGYLFNAGSPHLDAAWKVYLALFADLDYQKDYYEHGFGVSVIPQVLAEAEADGYHPQFETLVLGEGDRMWPKAPHEENGKAVQITGLDFYEVFKSLLYSQENIADALEELTERYNEAYEAGITQGVGREIKIPGFDPMNPQTAGAKP